MKTRLLFPVAVAILIAAPVMAFHDHGVAHCNGCHTMHNSGDGVGVNSDGAGLGVGFGYPDLLLYPNPSDTCLACHGNNSRSYNVFESDPLGPTLAEYYSAGNFVFLLEDNINDGHAGASNPILGEGAGHNIRSLIKGSGWDTTLLAPPGVASPLSNNMLECSSCHDPHGNSGFRMLYQNGQDVSVGGDVVTFGSTVVADSISYGAVEADNLHNAYHSGYSAWCASCHTGFHNAYGNLIHPSGTVLTAGVIAKYASYKGTQDCVDNPGTPCGTGGSATSYLADVPFEDAGTTTISTTGPTPASTVACVTCHRAHATSAANAGRWDFDITLLDEDGAESGSWAIPRSYTDADQRSLCNKCHTQDEFDHVNP